jgi:DNA-binding MarR family transcriptional regulator
MEQANFSIRNNLITKTPHKMMGGFSKTPNHFTLNKNYNPYDKTIYGVLLAHSMNKGYCFLSIKTIAEEAGCGMTKTKEVIKILTKNNFIRIEKSPDKNCNTYKLLSTNKSIYDCEGNSWRPQN